MNATVALRAKSGRYGARRTLGVVGPGFRQAPALRVFCAAGDGLLEFAHAAPEGTPCVGQSLRTEDDQGEHEDDDEFCWTDAWHTRTVMFGGPPLVKPS